ncbi:F0F1 ATP synthase subunit alpha [Candidatus Roizmanbacteria bacterium CG_4_10_14_0_8_um_filter_39_9]|uniref:ATP synthase subunit alpha n=1 Tax=Candidatus Roizmanbacteria bacterium CG_4_10_14_0_8_um_filter_39_9 TaxID=1974829 RepID=A0A2M7QEL2_9BACT|nr:MAG: F0F1 ATP synthase subunit alpha [Candidatus Roizmanbacteria bacterium CG_4_10_14_0_8_um_filter_39_9]
MKLIDDYLKEIEKDLNKSAISVNTEEIGFVDEVRDGVVLVTGLDNVTFGEVVEFNSGAKGYIIDLMEDRAGVVVLGDYLHIRSGERVKALNYTLSVPVSEEILGRVVDPLCTPQDNLPTIKMDKMYPVEKIAPTVVYRKSVTVPLQTGVKAIDALTPIGRGQRELIIGDRGTGKTTIALDTIINQKGQNVICIYCGIGQKNSKMALVVDLLRRNNALEYTVVVNAPAADAAALQYIAPYSASAIAEYFMDKGKDVLVIYDDLSKHAWAYRQISLILRRPAGREAYPGDIFYLHSRLLERSCRIDEKYGGGSITALPIVETLEGDVSAYIPTNIISITDGQIFLETDLFNAGVRPAINIGISVSRVGGNAQTKAMKQVAGKLKLDLAQYREMAAFSQFESDLDEETKKLLNRGAKVTQILKQDKNKPYSLGEEIVVLWAAHKGFLDTVGVNDVEKFEKKLIEIVRRKGHDVTSIILKEKIISPETEHKLEKLVKEVV